MPDAEHAQLTEGSCTCAAHDQVSRHHAVGHVVDVLGHFDVRVRVKVGACSFAILGSHSRAAAPVA